MHSKAFVDILSWGIRDISPSSCVEVREQTAGLRSHLVKCEFQGWNQVIRLDSKHLYPLRHIVGSVLNVPYFVLFHCVPWYRFVQFPQQYPISAYLILLSSFAVILHAHHQQLELGFNQIPRCGIWGISSCEILRTIRSGSHITRKPEYVQTYLTVQLLGKGFKYFTKPVMLNAKSRCQKTYCAEQLIKFKPWRVVALYGVETLPTEVV